MAFTRAAMALLLLGFVSNVAATFTGDLTYYGDNGWAGYCAGNVPNEGDPWPPAGGQYGQRVAMNSAQFTGPDMCGKKIMFRGTGTGLGGDKPSQAWQKGQVTNLCPECKYGDIDLGKAGDGRWGVEWYFVEGSGGNTAESTGSSARATVPTKTKKAYDWQAWLAKKRAARKTSAARKEYLWRSWLAKQRKARAAQTPQKPAWQVWLDKQRARRAAGQTTNWAKVIAQRKAAGKPIKYNNGRKLL